MFYFSILENLEDCTKDEIGELFLSAMRYGMTGEEPHYSDRCMKLLWKDMKRFVDKDNISYGDKQLQRIYAGQRSAYIRSGSNKEEFPDLEEWKLAYLKDHPDYYESLRPSTTVNDR